MRPSLLFGQGRYFYPALLGRGLLDRVTDPGVLVPVTEVGGHRGALDDRLDQVVALDNLGLAVADAEGRDGPEAIAIRVRRAGVDRSEAAAIGGVVREEDLELVPALVVEADRALVAVNLEGQEVVAPVRVPRRLK